ncbi:pectinesterase 3-like [Olea europaea subsp. europaea]|uniref:Pectinesterase 3-like n=1 Tax=Olea europaea subsp. europaea TaxID=158383 RepID=A0A8S0RS12_OLEEU|nr:pectinesterase 3-like [Olea europaea subsp. europaea]
MKIMDASVDSFKSAEDYKGFEERRNEIEYSADIFENIKNNEFEEQEYRRKTAMRLTIIAISSIVLILLIIGAIYGILVPMHTADNPHPPVKEQNSIKMVYSTKLFHEPCFSRMSSLNISSRKSWELKEVVVLSLEVALNELVNLSSLQERLTSSENYNHNNCSMPNASLPCEFLIGDAIEHVNMSILSLQTGDRNEFSKTMVINVRTWLNAAFTDQEMCLERLMKIEKCSGNVLEEMESVIRDSTKVINNFSEIIYNIITTVHCFKIPVHRKLLHTEQGGDTGFSGTVSEGELEA